MGWGVHMIIQNGRGDGRLVKNLEGTQQLDKAQDKVMSLNMVIWMIAMCGDDGVLWWYGMKAYLMMNGVGVE